MRVRYTQAALTEIDEIFAYIAADNPDAAARVVDRIEQVVARVGEYPLMGPRSDEPDVRLIPIGRYPYLIFYAVTDVVTILHVRHAARRR
jgi:addiction module RelE/StbE family toxin